MVDQTELDGSNVSEMSEVHNLGGASIQCQGGCNSLRHDQLFSAGVSALVNALSAPNPGAKEFAALALILLTSQGGYEVKSIVAEAGAAPMLIRMLQQSCSSTARELAAGAIASLVSLHPANRLEVIRLGGLKALVTMARSTCMDFDLGNANLMRARIQAAAAVATLNLSEALERYELGMGIEGALLQAATLLESEAPGAVRAGLGGLQAVWCSISVAPELSFELVSALLDVTKSSSPEARDSAMQELSCNLCSKDGRMEDLRKAGIEIFLSLLEQFPTLPGLPEAIVGTIWRNILDGCLSEHIVETEAVPRLLRYAMLGLLDARVVLIRNRLVSECPSLSTCSLAMCCIASLGAKRKRLEQLGGAEGVSLVVNILSSDPGDVEKEVEMARACGNCYYHQQHAKDRIETFKSHTSLREHAVAVLVYFALAGEQQKEEIVAAGGIPVLVKLLKDLFMPSRRSTDGFYSLLCSKLLDGLAPEITHEFAVMGLIVLGDKSASSTEKIVQAGGVPVLLRMLATPGTGAKKFGTTWTEMAAAALLTLAGYEAARAEMVQQDALSSLVEVLRGENKVSHVGVAAVIQLLGIVAREAELGMKRTGAVKCIADVLVAASDKCRINSSLVQQAAASALGSLALESPETGTIIVQAGAVEALIGLANLDGKIQSSSDLGVPSAAVTALRNMVTGCGQQTKQDLLKAGVVEQLRRVIEFQIPGEESPGQELLKLQEVAAHLLNMLQT